jgi:hypothetical protein
LRAAKTETKKTTGVVGVFTVTVFIRNWCLTFGKRKEKTGSKLHSFDPLAQLKSNP